jgi:hypothetical protein
MQLTHGMDCPPGGDLTATVLPLPLQIRAVPINVTANVADAVQQVDFVVSTSTSQPDVRVMMPVTNPLAMANTQQTPTAIQSLMGNTWHASPMSSAPVGSASPTLKRQSSASGHRSVCQIHDRCSAISDELCCQMAPYEEQMPPRQRRAPVPGLSSSQTWIWESVILLCCPY